MMTVARPAIPVIIAATTKAINIQSKPEAIPQIAIGRAKQVAACKTAKFGMRFQRGSFGQVPDLLLIAQERVRARQIDAWRLKASNA